jgi:hypothetical protein
VRLEAVRQPAQRARQLVPRTVLTGRAAGGPLVAKQSVGLGGADVLGNPVAGDLFVFVIIMLLLSWSR